MTRAPRVLSSLLAICSGERPGKAAVRVLCLVVALGGTALGQQSPRVASRATGPLGDAQRAYAEGRYAEVDALVARATGADAAAGSLLRARAAIARGEFAAADALLAPLTAQSSWGDAALELGLLRQYVGRTDDAKQILDGVMRGGARQSSVADLTRAGRAARALGRYKDADAMFREAVAASQSDPAANTAWGELFLEKHNNKDARESFEIALRADANWTPALIGFARAVADVDPTQAAAATGRALAQNPNFAPAHLLQAELAMDETKADAARQSIERVLAVNPKSLEARSLRAALAYTADKTTEFEAEVADIKTIHPQYSGVYRVASDHAARNYRFEDAVGLAKRALDLDHDDINALASLGMHLMRTGDEPAARATLTRAFDADPYNVVVFNLLALLDTLEKFDVIRRGDLEIKLHKDETPILQEYAPALAQQALDSLTKTYEFKPRGPILVEVFPRHDDFAVRTLGLPGLLGALGVCFGRVVTMDSPKARTPGSFSWEATLWHELAHVVTLQLSNQRMPRWLSEGISVFEERRARPDWGRETTLAFAAALERGETLPLKDLNAGFTNPKTITLAYYEASLLVEHIVNTYGQPKLRALVESFSKGVVTTEAAFTSTLGVEIDALQKSFDAALDKQFGAMRAAMKAPDTINPQDLDALRVLAVEHAGSFPVQFALGAALKKAGDMPGALAALDRAVTLLPNAAGRDSPRPMIAEIAAAQNDRPRAMSVLVAHLEIDYLDLESARKLATLAEAAGDEERAQFAYGRIAGVDPFDARAHLGLGRAALKRKDGEVAAREFRAALAAGAVDRAAVLCDLGEAYLMSGKRADARRQALAALEIAPNFVRAQDLLMSVAGGQP